MHTASELPYEQRPANRNLSHIRGEYGWPFVGRTWDMFRDPQSVAARVESFLGIPVAAAREFPHSNPAVEGPPMEPRIRRRLRAEFAGPNRELECMLGVAPGWPCA